MFLRLALACLSTFSLFAISGCVLALRCAL
jgi:hypothetical protein